MLRVFLFLATLLGGHSAFGFTLPDRAPGPISDFADVISPEVEAELTEQIETLQNDYGYALMIVSVERKDAFGWEGNLQNLAGRMRRDWTLENTNSAASILVLISKMDRNAVVATGSAYPKRFVTEPTQTFLTATQNSLHRGHFDRVAQRGVAALIKDITPKKSGGMAGWFGGAIIMVILLLPFALITLQKLDWFFVRFNKCPYCTRKTLRLDKQLQTYMPGKPGRQKEKSRVYCQWCGYRKDEERLSDSPDLMEQARDIPTKMFDP